MEQNDPRQQSAIHTVKDWMIEQMYSSTQYGNGHDKTREACDFLMRLCNDDGNGEIMIHGTCNRRCECGR